MIFGLVTEKPVIASITDVLVGTDSVQNTATVSFSTTVSDNVDPAAFFTPIFMANGATISSPHVFPLGVTTVTVTANADNAGNVPDPITFDVTVEVPEFTVTKTLTSGADPVTNPDTLTWTVVVENTGTIAATTPVITDLVTQDGATIATLVPSFIDGDTSNTGTLDANETWAYSAALNVTQAQIDAGDDITNTFTFAPDNAAAVNGVDIVAVATNPEMDIVKTVTLANGAPIPATGVTVGLDVKYTYTLTNTGNVTFSGINLADNHGGFGPLGAIGNCGVIADNGEVDDTMVNGPQTEVTVFGPLDVVTCEASYTVVQADIDDLQ